MVCLPAFCELRICEGHGNHVWMSCKAAQCRENSLYNKVRSAALLRENAAGRLIRFLKGVLADIS